MGSKELRCVRCDAHISGGYKYISPGRGVCAACLRREKEKK